MLLRNPQRDGEAEAGPALLRREVGLEHAGEVVGRDPRAGVAHRERDAARRARGPDGERPACVAERVEAVLHEVEQHLQHLVAIGEHRGEPRLDLARDGDAGRRRREERERRLDQLLRGGGRAVGRRQAGEPAELVDDLLEAPDLVGDRARPLLEDLREVGALLLERVAQRRDAHRDGGERVLDLVREAAGDLPPRRNPLRLREARPRLGEVGGHRVERADEVSDLPGGADVHAGSEVARRDAGGRVPERLDRPGDAGGEQPPRERRGNRRRRERAEEGEEHRRAGAHEPLRGDRDLDGGGGRLGETERQDAGRGAEPTAI